MELVITENTDDAGNSTLTLAGSMDLVTRQAILDAGTAALDRGGSLTLDLSDVTFIDSTGIGALVQLMNAAGSREQGFTVSGRSPRVARVLEVTGLESAWVPA